MRRSLIVLGAGPAGLGAALGLARRGFSVDVLERRDDVGGNAGSFEIAGLRVDYGSHRLHPSIEPGILDQLRELLGDDLLDRPRHGRIRLRDRWIAFPLRTLDLAFHLPPGIVLGTARDLLGKLLPRRAASAETFASVLECALGRTLCEDFYFPFARKVWGLEPEDISPIQAKRRVSAGSFRKLLRRLGRTTNGRPGEHKTRFYYPRRGYGQISERIKEAAQAAGARIWLGTAVHRADARKTGGFEVQVEAEGCHRVLSADHLWSTIPAARLVEMMSPRPPVEVVESSGKLAFRALVLVYVVLERNRFTSYDAHYFPGAEFPFTRISEPKNYAGAEAPSGRTVLCAELPCSKDDAIWAADREALADLVLKGLARAGLAVGECVLGVEVRRLSQAYPIYRRGYEAHFNRLDEWLEGVPNLLSFGRQGLFAHDNTHHALFMARAAVDCLDEAGDFSREKWALQRRIFETHVVED